MQVTINVEDVTKKLNDDKDFYDEWAEYVLGYSPKKLLGPNDKVPMSIIF